MMEEDDICKIADEIKEAANTDITEDELREFAEDLPSEEAETATITTVDLLVKSVSGMKIEANMTSAITVAGHATTNTTHSTPPQLAGDHDIVAGHAHKDVPFDESPPSQTTNHNPYRATTGLVTHVPATAMLGTTNIFMPPSVPSQQPAYPQYSSPSYNTSSEATQPPYNYPTYQQNSNNNLSAYNTQQSRLGEAFLEMPSEALTPGWPRQQQPSYENHHHHHQEGLMGWFSNVGSKVFEKTKSGVETMITTLDPGMKSVIYSGGSVDVVVTTGCDDVVEGVRMAFQEVFGKATISGMESRSDIANQPVGFLAGLKGAENRIENLRRAVSVHERQALLSVEFFIHELLPEKWYDLACMHLNDPMRNIDITLFSQATPINAVYVQQAQESTPQHYGLRWSGLAVTVGEVINRAFPHIHPVSWHKDVAGVARRDLVAMTAKTLASMYKMQTGIQ